MSSKSFKQVQNVLKHTPVATAVATPPPKSAPGPQQEVPPANDVFSFYAEPEMIDCSPPEPGCVDVGLPAEDLIELERIQTDWTNEATRNTSLEDAVVMAAARRIRNRYVVRFGHGYAAEVLIRYHPIHRA